MNFDGYDESVCEWVQEILENYEKKPRIAMKYCDNIIAYGFSRKDCKLQGFGYYYMVVIYFNLNDSENFFETMSKALEYLEKAQAWEYIAKCYNLLGVIAMNRGDWPIAYDYYLKGIAYCEKYNLPEAKINLNNNCGVLNLQSERYEEGMKFVYESLNYMQEHPEVEGYHMRIVCLYENIVLSKVMQGCFDEAAVILEKIYKYWNYLDPLAQLGVSIAEAVYYHKSGQAPKRDEVISKISNSITENIPFVNIIDDCFMYMEMLLECDKDKEFLQIINIMEPMVESFVQLKILSLKIKFYKKHGMDAEFLQAAGVYYELSERHEEENRVMMKNILDLRSSFENAKKENQKIKEQNRKLAEVSERDALTQLANRRKLERDASEAYDRALADNRYFAVEILDIDFFKEYNDNYGHQTGDEGIKAVASCIKEVAAKKNAVAARYGGDEFVLVYNCKSPMETVACAEELKQLILAKKIEHKFSKAAEVLTISQGICCDIPTTSLTAKKFLSAADEMLYRIKKQTRNNYCIGDVGGKVITI